MIEYKNKWIRSYETLVFDTPDGDLGDNDYAVDEERKVYLFREHAGINGQWSYADFDDKSFDPAGRNLVSIVPGAKAYYDEFLTAKGATDLANKPDVFPLAGMARRKSNAVNYRALAVRNAKQPERLELVEKLPPPIPDNSVFGRRSAIEHHSIGFDAYSDNGAVYTSVSSYAFSHTCGASADFLVFGDSRYVGGNNAYEVTAVTYNGSALTEARKDHNVPAPNFRSCVWFAYSPDTGSSYTVQVTLTNTVTIGNGGVCSYSGVAQSGQPDATAGGYGQSISVTLNHTTVADNCWVNGVTVKNDSGGKPTATLTERWWRSNYFMCQDTNAPKTPAGLVNVNWTGNNSGYWCVTSMSFAPAAGPVAPTVTTQAASSIGEFSATGNGNITDVGSENADTRGFVYGTSTLGDPGDTAPGSTSYDDYTTESGSFGTGAFTGTLADLQPNTTYYVRAWAHNAGGYSYGGEVNFSTDALSVVTFDATNITSSSATGTAYFNDATDIDEIGFEWGEDDGGPYPYEVTDTPAVVSAGVFELQMTGLSAFTGYYYRAKIHHTSLGWFYGTQVLFITEPGIPEVRTDPPSGVSDYLIHAVGTITSIGAATPSKIGFVYGLTSADKPAYSVAPADSDYDAYTEEEGSYTTETFTITLEDLLTSRRYYIRAYAYNENGYGYGEELQVISNPNVNLLYPNADTSIGVRFDSSPGGGYPNPLGGTVPHYQLIRDYDAEYSAGGTWGSVSGNYIYERNYYNENMYTDKYGLTDPYWVTMGVILTSAISAVATTLPVSSAAASDIGLLIKIDDEQMLITDADPNAFTLTVTRAYNGSSGATHSLATEIFKEHEDIVKVKWKARLMRNNYGYGKYQRELWVNSVQYSGTKTAIGSPSGVDVCEIFSDSPNTSTDWTFLELLNMSSGVSLGEEGGFGVAICDFHEVVALWANAAVETQETTEYDGTSATLNAKILEDEGESCEVYFEWGETTGYGNTTDAQTDKHKLDTFSDGITGLTPGTVYHYRAVIETACGETFYGADMVTSESLAAGTLTRVSAIRHIYKSGLYKAEVTLGDISSSIEVVQRIVQVPTVLPDPESAAKPPTVPLKVPEETADVVIDVLKDEGLWPVSDTVTRPRPMPPRIQNEPPIIDKVITEIKEVAPAAGIGSVLGLFTPLGPLGGAVVGGLLDKVWEKITPWKEEEGETFPGEVKERVDAIGDAVKKLWRRFF